MKKLLFFSLMLLVILTSVPISSFAYSYGDPNEETIAEAYKEMVAKDERKSLMKPKRFTKRFKEKLICIWGLNRQPLF